MQPQLQTSPVGVSTAPRPFCYLVTGGSGFLGRRLVELLLREHDFCVARHDALQQQQNQREHTAGRRESGDELSLPPAAPRTEQLSGLQVSPSVSSLAGMSKGPTSSPNRERGDSLLFGDPQDGLEANGRQGSPPHSNNSSVNSLRDYLSKRNGLSVSTVRNGVYMEDQDRKVTYIRQWGVGPRDILIKVIDRNPLDRVLLSDRRVHFIQADIRSPSVMRSACFNIDVVFHMAAYTASPYKPSGDSARVHASDELEEDSPAEMVQEEAKGRTSTTRNAFSSLSHDRQCHTTHVVGTRNVIDACLGAGVRALVYMSTALAVIAPGSEVRHANEASVSYPRSYLSAYARTKAQAERLVLKANGTLTRTERTHRGSQLTNRFLFTCALRPHIVIGPRDTHLMAKLVEKGREGLVTHIIGSGNNKVDFVYVDNVCYAMMLAAWGLIYGDYEHNSFTGGGFGRLSEKPVQQWIPAIAGHPFFITNNEPRKFWNVVDTVLAETGCMGPNKAVTYSLAYTVSSVVSWVRSVFSSWVDPLIGRDVVHTMAKGATFSCAKAFRLFGYRPLVSLDDGLRRTVAYLRQHTLLKSRIRARNLHLWEPHRTEIGNVVQHYSKWTRQIATSTNRGMNIQ